MALEELIALENIICVNSKVNLKATYTIINMKLTKLFDEVISEVEKAFLPILEMKILFYTLKCVVFSDEGEGNRIISELCKCLNQYLYASDKFFLLIFFKINLFLAVFLFPCFNK